MIGGPNAGTELIHLATRSIFTTVWSVDEYCIPEVHPVNSPLGAVAGYVFKVR